MEDVEGFQKRLDAIVIGEVRAHVILSWGRMLARGAGTRADLV